MIPNSVFWIFKGLFVALALYQSYLVCCSIPIEYPMLYRTGYILLCLIMIFVITGVESENESPEDKMVDRVLSYTKTIYDESNFMFNVMQGNIRSMKKEILKENNRDKLGIMERRYRKIEELGKILQKQSAINNDFHNGMIDLDNLEKELQEFDTNHK